MASVVEIMPLEGKISWLGEIAVMIGVCRQVTKQHVGAGLDWLLRQMVDGWGGLASIASASVGCSSGATEAIIQHPTCFMGEVVMMPPGQCPSLIAIIVFRQKRGGDPRLGFETSCDP